MEIILSVNETRIVSSSEHQEITIEDVLLKRLEAYNSEYQSIKQNSDNEKLLALGKKLFQTFATILSLDTWLNASSTKKLEIVSSITPNNLEILLLSLPWEILATEKGYLAEDRRLFEVIRRIEFANENIEEAQYSDITLTFMASDPNFESGLQYEVEERVILDAVQKHKNLHLVVEESGNLISLQNRLFDLGHCDMVHLSSHGAFDGDDYVLILEDDRFNVEITKAEDFRYLSTIIKALFISACHSAEFKNRKNMAVDMASIGIANVIGWDGAVKDEDATEFTASFYKYLQLGSSLSSASAGARSDMLQQNRNDWHLARVYLNAHGGKGLNSRMGNKSPKKRYQKVHKIIDAQKGGIKVASRDSFVGRRRETKRVHHAFDNEKSVLLYGLGGTGKSSLAVRIVERLNPPYTALFIYKNYDYFALLTAIEKEVSRNYPDLNFSELINSIRENPSRLYHTLVNLLENNLDEYPIVLVIDDLEQYVLEPLARGEDDVMVKAEYQLFFQSVISAFEDAETQSKLLLTSRYKFKMADSSDGYLDKINVPDMTRSEQIKHWLAISRDNISDLDEQEQYLSRIFEVSRGNPGLQDVLFAPLDKKEFTTLELALNKLESYHIDALSENKLIGVDDIDKYLQRIALEIYRDALTKTELYLLTILTIFNFPIPKNLIALSAEQLGIDNPQKALTRLDNFGLINHLQGEGVENHISCYGLVYKIIEPLSDQDRNDIAQITIKHLWDIWFGTLLRERNNITLTIDDIMNKDILLNEESYLNTLFSSKLEYQRLNFLYDLCLLNNLINWDEVGVENIEFKQIFELMLSLNALTKLQILTMTLFNKISAQQIKGILLVSIEEITKFKESLPNESMILSDLIFQRFSFRPDLMKKMYNIYFPEYSEVEHRLLQEMNSDSEEKKHITMIELSKNNQELASNLGNYAVFLTDNLQDYPKAKEMYERALEADPKHANILGNYAHFLTNNLQDYPKAQEMYERAIEADPKHTNILGNYAHFLTNNLQDYPKAQEMYERAIEAEPNHANNLGNYALFLTNNLQDYPKAKEMYERALEAEPKHTNNLGNYALFLKNNLQDYPKAKEMYERALEADPKHANTLGNYALFLKNNLQDYPKAQEMYERAIEADPKHAHTLGNYAHFLTNNLQDYPKAKEMYERAIEADPKHANNLGNYAKFLLVKAESKRGIELLEQAEKIKEIHNDLAVELAFYRYAHVQPYDLQALKRLMLEGSRSVGWDLSMNVAKAVEDNHPDSDMLMMIADVISGKEEIESLNKFLKWNKD